MLFGLTVTAIQNILITHFELNTLKWKGNLLLQTYKIFHIFYTLYVNVYKMSINLAII